MAKKETINEQAQSEKIATETPSYKEKVIVFCRLPSGFVLSIYPESEAKRRAELSAKGTPDRSSWRPKISIILNGLKGDVRYNEKRTSLGLAGRTIIDKDIWDEWIEQNKESDLIKNNIIFAFKEEISGKSKLNELSVERTGLEGVDLSDLDKGSATYDHEGMRQLR